MNYLPSCCGKKMKVNLELGRFLEAQCAVCDDTVYVKKYNEVRKPIMIDD